LYALLVRLTLSEDVADDLLQELVVRLSQSDGFRQADDSLRYARRAAIHLAFDWHRRRKRSGKIEGLLKEPAAAAASPLNMLIAREDYEQILASMKELSALSRTCLVLHYIEHLSYSEIAEQLGKSPHQVRGVCHKGIRRLQQLMGVTAYRPTRKEGIADES
jgi:RNA polymerase sigma factor (sigma-70 family)